MHIKYIVHSYLLVRYLTGLQKKYPTSLTRAEFFHGFGMFEVFNFKIYSENIPGEKLENTPISKVGFNSVTQIKGDFFCFFTANSNYRSGNDSAENFHGSVFYIV